MKLILIHNPDPVKERGEDEVEMKMHLECFANVKMHTIVWEINFWDNLVKSARAFPYSNFLGRGS
jgi:hypothetical protein